MRADVAGARSPSEPAAVGEPHHAGVLRGPARPARRPRTTTKHGVGRVRLGLISAAGAQHCLGQGARTHERVVGHLEKVQDEGSTSRRRAPLLHGAELHRPRRGPRPRPAPDASGCDQPAGSTDRPGARGPGPRRNASDDWLPVVPFRPQRRRSNRAPCDARTSPHMRLRSSCANEAVIGAHHRRKVVCVPATSLEPVHSLNPRPASPSAASTLRAGSRSPPPWSGPARRVCAARAASPESTSPPAASESQRPGCRHGCPTPGPDSRCGSWSAPLTGCRTGQVDRILGVGLDPITRGFCSFEGAATSHRNPAAVVDTPDRDQNPVGLVGHREPGQADPGPKTGRDHARESAWTGTARP